MQTEQVSFKDEDVVGGHRLLMEELERRRGHESDPITLTISLRHIAFPHACLPQEQSDGSKLS